MPVISTSSTTSGITVNITTATSLFVTATTVLESTGANVIALNGPVSRVSLTVAGHLMSSSTYYAMYSFSDDSLFSVRFLAGSSSSGSGILGGESRLELFNAGDLFGEDTGVDGSSFADTVTNSGTITTPGDFAGGKFAVDLKGGDDTLTNSGDIFGHVNLNLGEDRFYGAGGSIFGSLDAGNGNDLIDLRRSTLTGDAYGGSGNDTFIVDDASFSLIEEAGFGTDLVKSSVTWELGDNFENLTLIGTSNATGTGNALANLINGNAGDNRLYGGLGGDKLFGGAGDDALYGGRSDDVLNGGDGEDRLYGGAHNDTLVGGIAEDLLVGGAGRDLMTGDAGTSGGYADIFVFNAVSDSANSALSDRITDFHIGEDKIDLSAIDARSATSANDAFTFITTAFTNVAGQLRVVAQGADTAILGDVSGDGVADFRILLTGNLTLTAADIIL